MVSPKAFFSCGHGLRQGDPLSPYLFIIVVEVPRRNIQKLVNYKSLKGVKVSSSLLLDSHQQFANDTLMFGEAWLGEAGIWKQVMDGYVVVSSYFINYEKSKIYFFNTDQMDKGKSVENIELPRSCPT